MSRVRPTERFRIEEFINPSGAVVWRVSGTRTDGTRVRRNFPTRAEALEGMAEEEEMLANLPAPRRTVRTTLDADQLSDAETAVQMAGGRPVSRLVSRLLDCERRAAARGVDLDASISYQAERDRNEGLTAFNNGTSKEMMDRHYRDVLDDPAAVEAFWAITPESLAAEMIRVRLPHQDDTGWPAKAKLKRMVWERALIHVARDLGVSDVALKKYCVKTGIELPPRGYWLRGKA